MKLSVLSSLAVATLAVADRQTMDRLMSMKLSQRETLRASGAFAPAKYVNQNRVQRCKNGKAGEYACENVDMHGFLSHEEMGSKTREGNDIWGWTSPEGREFGAVGQTDGTAFVEIMKNGQVEYRGRLPTQTENSVWRDMKIVNGYCYIGSEAADHGVQVFDMRKLLDIESGNPKEFTIEDDLTAWYSDIGSSHNIIGHEEADMVYAVGTSRDLPCKGGLYMLDVSDPSNPTSPGCASEDAYVHDAQCVIYKGPDEEYIGQEICFNYDEDSMVIMDVTDKNSPTILSNVSYDGASYTHQGWLADPEDMSYLLLDDELDEVDQSGKASNNHTTTYIFDITSLKKPTYTGFYQSPAKSIDHNQYVLDGLSYQSNYGSGLRIVDVSSIFDDPTGADFKQAGFFDCHPEDDAVGGVVEFVGSWSVYPYFPSGFILLNSIERGVFSLKYTGN